MFRFRLGPFPVTVYPWFFISAVLLGGGSGFGLRMLIWVLVVFVSVLFHELGHAVVGKALGGAPEIRLIQFGGVTTPNLRRRPSAPQQIALSIAGPAFGLLLGGAALVLLRAAPPEPGSPSAIAMNYFVYTSVIWAVFNMMPILPLDGGQAMLAILEGVRKRRSLALASWISVFVCALAALYIFYTRGLDLWLLVYVGFFAFTNVRQALALGGPAAPQVPSGPPADPVADFEIARAGQEARAALSNGDPEAALNAALRLENAGGPVRQAAGLRLRAGIELSQGRNEMAALLAGQSFSIVPHADAAVVAARANLRGRQEERARNWVRRALELGAAETAVRADPELGALHAAE